MDLSRPTHPAASTSQQMPYCESLPESSSADVDAARNWIMDTEASDPSERGGSIWTDNMTEDQSDNVDPSDDGGAPMVNYLSIANLLNDVDDEGASPSIPGHEGAQESTQSSSPLFGQMEPEPAYAQDWLPVDGPPAQMLPAQAPTVSPTVFFGPPPLTVYQAFGPQLDWDDGASDSLVGTHPASTSILNPVLIPLNSSLEGFLRSWSQQAYWQRNNVSHRGPACHGPSSSAIDEQKAQNMRKKVEKIELQGDECDMQGLQWTKMGVTRREARERRLLTYRNYVRLPNSDAWTDQLDNTPNTENYFRFKRMHLRRNMNLAHFQLRNLLAAPSQHRSYYAGESAIHCLEPVAERDSIAMTLDGDPKPCISTLATDGDVLVAGGFRGEYWLRNMSTDNGDARPYAGVITDHENGITNHVQLHSSRASSVPHAAFASNDNGLRVIDLYTGIAVSETMFDWPLNCTAVSPDRRQRLIVGDDKEILVVNAESGRRPDILQRLSGHRDWGFACAWADDGWTVATGFQDRAVRIWDARYWTDSKGLARPVCSLRTEMAGARSLKFSPVGSGKRVLVAAEEADIVNIIDAQTFRSRQTIDIFGEIGGVAFTDEGHELQVLCCDRMRGGIIQLERCNTRSGVESMYDAAKLQLGYAEEVHFPSNMHRHLPGLTKGVEFVEHSTMRSLCCRGLSHDWPATSRRYRKRRQDVAKRYLTTAPLNEYEP